MRTDRDRLLDIEEAILKIEQYAARGESEFKANELIQTWILFHFQVIGEAARSLSAEMRATNPQVVWQDIIDFRNLLIHEYFRVDLDLVWSIVERELPILKTQIADLLDRS